MTTLVDNEHMQINRTKIKIEGDDCETCYKVLQRDNFRFKWRMKINSTRYFHNGSFWCVQCEDCFNQTLVNWDNQINEARELL